MALSTHRASPSLAWDESPPRWKFDVFLSFRGEDTRWGFISHLYRELEFWRALKIFKDDRELEIGASISPELLRAIEQSHLAIVVLSPDYASSTWCLDELSKIIESMEIGDKRILPVFFNVDPSDVRHQRKSFAEAFAEHEKKFSDQIVMVERWREALKKVSNFSGWHAKNFKCESELIQVIVRCVWEKLHPTITLSDCKDKLVGIEIGLGQMSLYLAPEEKDVRIIGIWGMGGVGKTTLARLVYEKLSHKFEVAKFLVDGTIVDLQKQILSPTSKENNSQVWNEHEETLFIRKYLSNKKVLLVFDDVNRCDHLKSLTRYKSWFGDGSRIIVTTRDERVLVQNDIEMSFELAGLSPSKALELFCQHAFKKDQPEEGFSELAKCFVDYAQGLPLALEVLGGFLYKRDLDAWNSELESLKRIPDPTIFNLLKLSYDALDDLQKNIFLDIAFFYKGLNKRRVIELLQYCYGLNVRIVIDVLKEKSLLTIGLYNNVGMHGLVQEMACEIVRQESREEPGFRSRLCHRNDIFHVFMRNSVRSYTNNPSIDLKIIQVWDEYKGTIFIRKCLSNKKVLLVFDDVDSCDHLEKLAGHKSWFGEGSRIIVTTRYKRLLTERRIELSFELVRLNDNDALELFSHKAFEKDQPKEGFLELSKCFVDYVEGLPLALKILGSSLYKRDLEAWKSALDKLKKGCDAKVFNSLKISYDALDYMEKSIFLDIAFFYTGVKKGRVIESLESCDLSGHYGIELLIEKSLITIDPHNNVGMHGLVQEMACEIVRQESREEPGFRSRLCHRNDIFHVFMRNSGTEAIKGIRLCLPRLEEADSSWNSGFRPNILAELKMQGSNLVRLWDGRQDLPNLKYMDLSGSKNLKETPDFTGIPNLEKLNLACCDSLVKVHPSIAVNKKLKRLTLDDCKNVKVFPSTIEMDSLEFLYLDGCSKVKIPEFGEGMKNLCRVLASGTASEELPSSIEHLVGLNCLFINDSKSLQSFPGTAIFKLKSRRELEMSGCPKLKKLVENTGETKDKPPAWRQIFKRKSPEPVCLALPSPGALSSLQELSLDYCNLCQGVIPDDIGYCLPSLVGLNLCGNNFVSLPPSIKCLSKLRVINLERCKRLQQLPDLPSNEELSVLADDCDSLKMLLKPSQQGRFTKLVSFRLTTVNCFGLIDNEGLNNGIFSMLRRLAAQGISPVFLSSLRGGAFRPSFDIVSPGSKISEWFDIQSEGDSLTVELPPDRESEWMGIVFCVVLANQKDPDTLKFDNFVIECSSPGIRRKQSVQMGTVFHMPRSRMMGDHLWVSFMRRGQIQDTTSCSIRFVVKSNAHYYTFGQIQHSGHIPFSNCVKRCGARLLYEQDLKNLLDGTTNILKRSREYCDSEEAEPGEGPSAIAIGSSNKESVFKRLKA